MQLRRSAHDSAFFSILVAQAELVREANLVLAELSGISAHKRHETAERMFGISDSADEAAGAMVRLLRENYLPPLDRRSLYVLSDSIRDVNHRLNAVGTAMASSAFDELPTGVVEMLSLLSQEADLTLQMTKRLSSKLDQWDFVERMSSLHNRAIALQSRATDPAPSARSGVAGLAATLALGNAFIQTSNSAKKIGRAAAEIAIRES